MSCQKDLQQGNSTPNKPTGKDFVGKDFAGEDFAGEDFVGKAQMDEKFCCK